MYLLYICLQLLHAYTCTCTFSQSVPSNTRIIRCMPNTPVVVRNGVTIYAMGSSVRDDDKNTVEQLLSSVGVCHEMDEYYLDVITGLTGCGPSYVRQIMYLLYGLQGHAYNCFPQGRIYTYIHVHCI